MKEDLLLALLFAFLPGMLIGKDKRERVVKERRKCSYSGDKGNCTLSDDIPLPCYTMASRYVQML